MEKINDDRSKMILHNARKKDIRYCVLLVACIRHQKKEKNMGSNGTTKSDDITKRRCAQHHPGKPCTHS